MTYAIGDYVHWSRADGTEGSGVIIAIRAEEDGQIVYDLADPDDEVENETVYEHTIDGYM